MEKNYYLSLKQQLLQWCLRPCLTGFFLCFACVAVLAQSSQTLLPVADAFVRNGSYAASNYGRADSLVVKNTALSGFSRLSYLKFSLSSISNVSSAKLRIYGRNVDNTKTISLSPYGVNNDSWTETGITFNNAPTASTSVLGSASVNNVAKYYEIDVTNYVKAQLAGDKVVSFLIKDAATQNSRLNFNSKENAQYKPQLIIATSASSSVVTQSNAKLFIENLDKFPSNDRFVFSRIQVPWSRDGKTYNANHDSLTVRIHNKGISNLIINNLILSNNTTWKFVKLKGVTYNSGTSLPLTISSGTYADLTVKFVAKDAATRVAILYNTLTIASNDSKFPSKVISFKGLWQKKGEDVNEPHAQEMISTFGFKTKTGYGFTDPYKGDPTKLLGDEIKPSYFVRADASMPVLVTQMAAYHGCCTDRTTVRWYAKGSTTLNSIFTHIGKDGQSLLPRKATPNIVAAGVINPTTAFGFNVGTNYTDANKHSGGKKGFRVWKAIDEKGSIIPNSYIIGNDYLNNRYTNYDYNDNMYFVKNVKPEIGSAFFSALQATTSALDFGQKLLQSTNSLTLNLSSLGKSYTNGSRDPAITISSVRIVGENTSEFSASMPAKTTLYPQEKTTLTVRFTPKSQGLKIADLLIYYNNSQSPLRVPLYGIAKASSTTVTANYRVNSGSATSLTINGKTWSADTRYSFDNLEPYANSKLTKIAGTDEDALYLREQSSDADKAPFRYEFPVTNGDYVVRLHFAEVYWGTPGSGASGGAGSRVMSVALENKLRLVNLDVAEEVGAATALVKNIPVTVTDGKLNINFSASVNRPMVMAVEVYSFRSSSSRPVDIVGADNNLTKVRAYPIPLQKTLNITFPANYKGNINLQILDAVGRVYQIGKVNLQAGGSNMEVNISKFSLKPGYYYLKITSDTKPVEIIKLIVL